MAIAYSNNLAKSLIALGFGLSVPLALNRDDINPVVAGFIGGATAGAIRL